MVVVLSSFDITWKWFAALASYPSLLRAHNSIVPPALVLTLKGKWSLLSKAQVLKAKPILFS
jgi:hypothetical protein